MKVAIPCHRGRVAPRFGCSTHIGIYTIRGRRVVHDVDFTLESKRWLDRLRLLRDEQVDTLICGGIGAAIERMVEASGIPTISWVAGTIDHLLDQFLAGELVASSARLGHLKSNLS